MSLLPRVQSALVDSEGRPTREFYNFFQRLQEGVQSQIDGIGAALARILSLETDTGALQAAIDALAPVSNDLSVLTGTNPSPGLAVRTGRDAWAFRGIATATVARLTVTSGDGVAGNPTLDLATVTDAGGGTLQKTAFDAYGRKTGTSAATTTDLSEGTNLYFTIARSYTAVKATLLAGANITITPNDSAGTLTIAAASGSGSTTPTGTGFRRIIGGDESAAATFDPPVDDTSDLGIFTKRWKNVWSTFFRMGDTMASLTSTSGTPEGLVAAVPGSICTRGDGAPNPVLYIKETGSGNTGWIPYARPNFNRIDQNGDIRVAADGSLRVSD